MAESAVHASIVPKGYTPVYAKRWRTLILVPTSIADEVREALRSVECIARLEAAMKQVVSELEEDFDTVDGGDGQPAPNKSMRLAHELQEAMYGPGGF